MTFLEVILDVQASVLKFFAWWRGFQSRGLVGAYQAAAGLSIS